MSKELVKERVIKYLVEDLLVPLDVIDTDVNLSEFEEGAEGVLDILVNVVEKDENNEEVCIPMLVVKCLDEDVSLSDNDVLNKQLDKLQEIDDIVLAGRYVLTNGNEMSYNNIYEEEDIPTYEDMLKLFFEEEEEANNHDHSHHDHNHTDILPLSGGCGCKTGKGCDCEDGCGDGCDC